MPNPIELKSPDGVLIYEFDWSGQLAAGVTLVSVQHTVPDPLVKTAELTDIASSRSLVEIAGGEHGSLYVISAIGTTSTGEQVPGQFTLRVVASQPS